MRAFVIAALAILGGAPGIGEVDTTPQHAVTVHLKLSDSDFGNERELEDLFDLEEQLERAILAAAAGEFDGNAIRKGQCTLYMYGPNAEALFTAIAPILRKSSLARGAKVTKRTGPPGSREDRLEL